MIDGAAPVGKGEEVTRVGRKRIIMGLYEIMCVKLLKL